MTDSRNKTPNERAPCLLIFGELAPWVAKLIRARPLLIGRLIVAPPEAIHAMGAFLHLAPAAANSDAEVAETINGTDPRKLLGMALPECPRRLYRALSTAGDRVLPKGLYSRLGAVCRGPFSDALLDGDLTENRIAYYEALSGMDPAMATLRQALRENSYTAEAVDTVVSMLRSRGVLRDDDMRLSPGAGMPAVARRIRKALGQLEAPDPGFLIPGPFRLVKTTDELEGLARRFENCLGLHDWNAAKHHINMVEGRTIVLTSDDPPLVAALHRVSDGVWQFEQCAGPKNCRPPAGVQSRLIRDLTAAGLRVVRTDPHNALATIMREARRGHEEGDDQLDDDDQDEEDDDDIAA